MKKSEVVVERTGEVKIIHLHVLSAPVVERKSERMLSEDITVFVRSDGTVIKVSLDGTEAKPDDTKGFRSLNFLYYSDDFSANAPAWLQRVVMEEINR